MKKLWVWMDVSATCNLACRDCYTKHAHAPQLLTTDQFSLMLGKLSVSPYRIERLHLNWRGEPLTNKRLADFLVLRQRYLPNCPLEFHTNGLLLTPQRCTDIVANLQGGDLVYVSVDGGNRLAHESNRGAETWAPTLQALAYLLDARDASAAPVPHIGIYEINYRQRGRYDEQLLALGRRCDSWTRVGMIGREGAEAIFDTGAVPTGPCFWAGHSLCITATGDVHICLLSFRPDGLLGNLLHDELTAIVDRAGAFRNQLEQSGRASLAHCKECRKTEGVADDAN